MNVEAKIAVQIQKTDREFIERLSALNGVVSAVLETSSFDGLSEIVSIIVTLTPAAAALIGKLVTEQIRSRRYIKIVCRGVQIQGLSEKSAAAILSKLAEVEAAKSDRVEAQER